MVSVPLHSDRAAALLGRPWPGKKVGATVMSEAGFLDADLAAILEAGDFDEVLEYIPKAAAAEPGAGASPAGQGSGPTALALRGHFHGPTGEQSPGDLKNPVLARLYSVVVKESDLPGPPARDDLILARGQAWRVWRIHSDGQGLLTISLQRANK